MKPIVLASSSQYRKELLSKTGLRFECQSPGLDEADITARLLQNGASPEQIASELSVAKAQAVFDTLRSEDPLIISGDQLVSFQGKILGKPGHHDAAINQLSELNGHEHTLITCITLKDTTGVMNYTHTTHLLMKNLSAGEIQRYVEIEKPYDCAGSYKIESKGIALFAQIDCDDFTAIQGIPMIWLTRQLKARGYEFFRN